MNKGPESTKLHVILIYLSGKHANNFSGEMAISFLKLGQESLESQRDQ